MQSRTEMFLPTKVVTQLSAIPFRVSELAPFRREANRKAG